MFFLFLFLYAFMLRFVLGMFFSGGYLVRYFVTMGWFGELTFRLVFDFVSLGFFLCVSFISGVVFVYRLMYISGGIDIRRFVYLVFLFVVSIFLLVFSGSFVVTIIGWDGLGLVSFCLVIFYKNRMALESGLVTVFSNRVGDCFFLLRFFFFSVLGTFGVDGGIKEPFLMFGLIIFLGAITKSAQVPFSA